MHAHKFAIPRPEFLTTVGNSSVEYRKSVATAMEEPDMPTKDSENVIHSISADKQK